MHTHTCKSTYVSIFMYVETHKKNMHHEMENGFAQWLVRLRVSEHTGGHL